MSAALRSRELRDGSAPHPVTRRQLQSLRVRLNALLDRALEGDAEARSDCSSHLQTALAEWSTDIAGRATASTLTDSQLQGLLLRNPRRGMLVAAARQGCTRAQEACAQLLNEELL